MHVVAHVPVIFNRLLGFPYGCAPELLVCNKAGALVRYIPHCIGYLTESGFATHPKHGLV